MFNKLALQIAPFLFLTLFTEVKSQNSEVFLQKYAVRQYTDEHGLPQNSVKSIAADKNGFIWLATENGLVRFDGIHFYTFGESNTGITNSRFFELQPSMDADRNCFYASSDDGTLRIQNGIAVADTMYRKKIDQKLHYIKDTIRNVFVSAGLPHKVNITNITALYYKILCPETEGSYYIFDQQKVEFFKNWSKSWGKAIPDKNYQHYFRLNNDLFLLSPHGHILHILPSRDRKMPIVGDILKDTAYGLDKTNTEIYWNNISDQVFLLLGQKFYHLTRSPSGWNTKLILDNFDFKKNNITSVHYNIREGRLFLGSVTRGLFVISKKNFQTLTINENDITNVMYAQTLLKSKEIVIPQGYIIGQDEVGQEKIKASIPSISSRNNQDRRAILTDRSGNIWVKNENVLYVYDCKGEKLLHSWKFTDEIKTLYEGKDGRIWLAMKSAGLYYLRANEMIPRTLKLNGPRISEGTFLWQTSKRSLFVGTNSGLYEIDLVTFKNTLVSGTEKLDIRSLYVSRHYPPGIFITTYQSGVFLYAKDTLVQFPLDGNKYLAAAHCIAEDNKGFFWIPTNKGLFRFFVKDMLRYASRVRQGYKPTENLYYSYYVKESGFLSNEFNGGCQPCMLKLPNGKISLPSLNGMVIFDPQTIEPNLPEKAVFLDRYAVSGKTYINQSDTILFEKDPEQISFNIAIAHFGNENERQLSYRLSPLNAKPDIGAWIPLAGNDPTIRLTKLLYGNYYLSIKSQNGFGPDNFLIKKILIKVPPHWYETIWFRILCLAFILCAIYCYTRARTTFLRRKNEELEQKICIRTAKLQETLSALRRSEKELNRQMYIRDRLVASISHDLHTPMKYLIQSAERIEGLIEKGHYKQVSFIGGAITKSSLLIEQLLENMVIYIKAKVYHDELQLKSIDLRQLVQEKIDLFAPALNEQSNQLQIKLGAERVFSDKHLLGVIVHNLIDNANKHTFNGLIMISTEAEQDALHLIIKDSGPGMPDTILQWLNKPASEQAFLPKNWNGLGLLIVKEIAEMIGVKILAHNSNGTSVRLTILPASSPYALRLQGALRSNFD